MEGDAGDMVRMERQRKCKMPSVSGCNWEFCGVWECCSGGNFEEARAERWDSSIHSICHAPYDIPRRLCDTLHSLLEILEDKWGQLEMENNDNLETTSTSLLAKRHPALITCLTPNLRGKIENVHGWCIAVYFSHEQHTSHCTKMKDSGAPKHFGRWLD